MNHLEKKAAVFLEKLHRQEDAEIYQDAYDAGALCNFTDEETQQVLKYCADNMLVRYRFTFRRDDQVLVKLKLRGLYKVRVAPLRGWAHWRVRRNARRVLRFLHKRLHSAAPTETVVMLKRTQVKLRFSRQLMENIALYLQEAGLAALWAAPRAILEGEVQITDRGVDAVEKEWRFKIRRSVVVVTAVIGASGALCAIFKAVPLRAREAPSPAPVVEVTTRECYIVDRAPSQGVKIQVPSDEPDMVPPDVDRTRVDYPAGNAPGAVPEKAIGEEGTIGPNSDRRHEGDGAEP